MAELDLIYGIIAAQAIGMLVITAIYNALRLRTEGRKLEAAQAEAASSKASFEAMVEYHSRRLDLEQEKLELARKNGTTSTARIDGLERQAALFEQRLPDHQDEGL